jgi:HEXXH motif-containing protein
MSTAVEDLIVAEPPLAAVPLHGSSELDRFLDAFVVQWILRVLALGPKLEAAGLDPPRVRLVGALANLLVTMSPAEARARLLDPVLAACLGRLRKAAGAGDVAASAREVDALPVLLIRDLDTLAPDGAPLGPVELPNDARVVPVGLRWRIAAAGARLAAAICRTDEGVVVTGADGAILCRIPATALQPGADGAGIDVASAAVAIAPRTFILDGRVEVLPDKACPELSARVPEERRCRLGTGVVERELRAALDLIREVWPESLADVSALFGGLFPIRMPAGGWCSASTSALPFVLQLTIRRAAWPFLLADSILHETAHTKLDMAMMLTPLILNDDRRIYRHPWRPDLRPLAGVLLGAHAFLSVLKLYEGALRLRPADAAARRQYERRRGEVGTALATLEQAASFTPAGAELFQRMVDEFEATGGA